jgi:hypothetical protein
MAIQISWLVEDRIIYWYDKGAGSVAGVKGAEIELIRMMEQSSAAQVHIVLDLQEVTEMPTLADSIRAKYEFPKHPKCGWSVFAGTKDPMQKMLLSILGNIFKVHTRLVPNNLAALEFLETVDNTLPDLTPYKERFSSKV